MMKPVPRLAASLARLVLGSFFNRIEVVGQERLPEAAPLLFVANHNNGLVDPLLILGLLSRRPHFLAKSVLWRNPLLGRLFDWGGVIPVYRPQDPGVDASRNTEMFARCHQVLAAGGSIAIFPEGRSHDEPSLSPLRTGAARIALGAEKEHGPIGLRIVPVGLIFDEKTTFRSRALVVVGQALEPVSASALEATEDVKLLTNRIDESLREVSHDWSSWEDAHWVSRAVSIASRPAEQDLPGQDAMAELFARGKLFQTGLSDLRQSHPERLQELQRCLEEYDSLLRLFGLRDDHVATRYRTRSILTYLIETAIRLGLVFPFAMIAYLLSFVPYVLCDLVAKRSADAPDEVASYKIYAALAIYPASWAAEAVGIGLWLGGGWGFLAFLAAPLCSYLSLDFRDRRSVLLHEARAFLRLRKRGLEEELRLRRERVASEISILVEFYASLRSDTDADQR